jgi:tetratricopeptide (TPR) repeat protein
VATAKEKLIASAQKLVEKGSFEKAIKEYLRVVQEDDADVRIWLKIGDLYAKIGKKPEATETYQRVAQFYSDQGFYLKSVAVYKQILKLEPRLIDVNQRLAELYKQLGLISDAIHQYEQVAGFFHKEGRVRDALAAMKQIVELDPETVAARIKLAEMYSRENMPREAIDEFTKAAEQLKEQARVDEYMKVAERLLFHAPDNRPVTKELARLYIDKNDPRRALPKLQVLFKADPRDLDVLRLLARAFEGLEQRPKAVSVYKELARILTEQGDTRGAVEVFQQILAIQPDDTDAATALKAAGGGRRAGSGLSGRQPSQARRPTPPPPLPSTAERSLSGSGAQRAQKTTSERALDSGGQRALAPPVVRDQPTMRPGTASVREQALQEAPEFSDDVVNEEIAKILNETDVYIKYNLHAKAIEHLQRVFERVPRHVAAREKLKALYITTGRKEEAVLELWALAEAAEPGRARRYVREIYELDPNNTRAAEILGEPVGGRRPAPVEEEAADDFGVAISTDFGLPTNRRADPPTRRARALEPEPLVPIEEDLGSMEAEAELVEEIGELEPEPLPLEPAEDDDLIPVVVDSVSHRTAASAPASPALEDDRDRFSLDDEPSVEATFEGNGAQPSYETAEPDAETRFAGGPRGIAAPPHSFDVAEEEATGTAQESIDEFASFDDPSQPSAKILEPPPRVSAEAAVELDQSPPTGSGRRPAPAPIPDPIRAESNLEDDLDESDFFMQQSLLDEARSMLSSLLERYPDHPLVVAKMRELEALERGSATSESPPLEPLPAESAISAQLPNDLPGSGEVHELRPEKHSGEHVEVTRRGVIERGVSAEDFETHYDLGIAYKEMGLIDDAIAEFRIVMKDPAREVQCQLMIGLCLIEKQQFTEAINQFKKGLYVEGITDPEALSLYYELGQAYEKIGDPREALYYYDKVQKRDPKFRDLPRRLRALRGEEQEQEKPQRSEDLDAAFDSLLEEG